MKIIHVSPAYVLVLAGEELHMKVLSDGLASHGHDVTVLTVNAWRRQISFAVSAMGGWRKFGAVWACMEQCWADGCRSVRPFRSRPFRGTGKSLPAADGQGAGQFPRQRPQPAAPSVSARSAVGRSLMRPTLE